MNSKKDIAKKVKQEHQGLNHEMKELIASARKKVSADEFSGWRLEFMWQLRDFKNHLLKHFDLEEEGGFMQDVLNAAPHEKNKVKQLKREHAQLTDSLDAMTGVLKNMTGETSNKVKEINVALDELVDKISKHESEEHRLMQRTYFREYGGPA